MPIFLSAPAFAGSSGRRRLTLAATPLWDQAVAAPRYAVRNIGTACYWLLVVSSGRIFLIT